MHHCGTQWLTKRPEIDFLVNMSASADVLAQAKVEIDLAAIPEGKNVSPAPPTFQRVDIDIVV